MANGEGTIYESGHHESDAERLKAWEYPHKVSTGVLKGLLRELGFESHKWFTLLDVGAGPNPALGQWVKEKKGDYLGFDVRKDFAEEQRKAGNACIQGRIQEGIPLPDRSVDITHTRFLLMHLPPAERDAAVREILRVSGKGAVFMDWNWAPIEGGIPAVGRFKTLGIAMLQKIGGNPFTGADGPQGEIMRTAESEGFRTVGKTDERRAGNYYRELIELLSLTMIPAAEQLRDRSPEGSEEKRFWDSFLAEAAEVLDELETEGAKKRPAPFVPASIGIIRATRMETGASRESREPGYADDWHNGIAVRKALHLDDPRSGFQGKKIYFAGDLPGWDFVPQLERKGASVTAIDASTFGNTVGNPTKRHTIAAELKRMKEGGKLDQVLFSTPGLAAYPRKELPGILKAGLDSVDFERGGEFAAVSFDFGPMEEYEEASDAQKELQQLMLAFFKVVGLDPHYGRHAKQDIEQARGRREDASELEEAREEIDQRPAGPQYWEELQDLREMLIEQVNGAIADMEKVPLKSVIRVLSFGKVNLRLKLAELKTIRGKLVESRGKIEEILRLPEDERPAGMPPRTHIVTVRAKGPTRAR